MLTVMTSNNHRILSLKLILISSAVVSTAAMLKFSVPVVSEILVSDVPAIWTSIAFWLRPPYLYLLLNFIIISILASSMLHHEDLVDPLKPVDYTVHRAVGGDVLDNSCDRNANEDLAADVSENDVKSEKSMASERENDEIIVLDPPKLSVDLPVDYTVHRAVGDVLDNSCDRNANEDLVADVSENDAKPEKSMASERENNEIGEADRIVLRKDDSMEILRQKHDKKPPISSKIGNRKVAKAGTPNRAGAKSRRSNLNGNDTLDDAWKAITEGRSAPFSRALDKSDTFESQTATVRNSSPKKSETTCKAEQAAAAAREEELKRQVEAFIEKFKEGMRLQREESLKKFRKMMNYERGYDY